MTWILGGTYYDSTEAMELYGFRFYTNPDETYPYYDAQYTLQSNKAVYGSLTYSITDAFRGTVGYRYSKDKNGYTGIHMPAIYSVRPWDPENMPTSKSMFHGGYKGGDKKVGIEYDWNDDVMLYADWSTSYRSQAHGGYNQVGDPWPPEFVDAYTLGMKSRFFENRLELNTSAYYYDYTNYLGRMDTGTIIDENENGVQDAWEVSQTRDPNGQMAGSIGVSGLDIMTSTLITPKDKFDLSISYLKGEFDDMLFDYWDITNSLGIPDFNANGMPKTNSPEWTVSAAYNHIFHMPNGGTLTFRTDSKYQSEYLLQWQTLSINTPPPWVTGPFSFTIEDVSKRITQEGYTCSNASLVYANPDGKYTFTAYLNNIEDYAAKLSYGGMRGNMVITDPRTWGFILSVNF
jgi:iron complex outermembrane receptor protein